LKIFYCKFRLTKRESTVEAIEMCSHQHERRFDGAALEGAKEALVPARLLVGRKEDSSSTEMKKYYSLLRFTKLTSRGILD